MRQIASFEESDLANRFTDYLVSVGIPSQADTHNGTWEVWVRDEDQLAKAKDELAAFRSNPHDDRYARAQQEAKKVRSEQAVQRQKAAKNTVVMKSRWTQPLTKRAPVTMFVVGTCVVLFLLTYFGNPGNLRSILSVCDPAVYVQTRDVTHQIRNGQLWRLLTPNLLHGDPLHIFFNMYWLIYLGGQIEFRKSATFYIGLMILLGIASMGLHLIMSPAPAVGMSGVVYGLFGYIWMKVKFESGSGFVISDQTILILIIWFFICFANIIPGVANWAHAGGLLTGMAIGYGPTLYTQRQRKSLK